MGSADAGAPYETLARPAIIRRWPPSREASDVPAGTIASATAMSRGSTAARVR